MSEEREREGGRKEGGKEGRKEGRKVAEVGRNGRWEGEVKEKGENVKEGCV